MTYETAINWAIEHIPMSEFDSFEDWYDQLQGEFQTPNLTNSEEFNSMAQRAWSNSGRELDQQASDNEQEFQEQEAEERQRQPTPRPIPQEPQEPESEIDRELPEPIAEEPTLQEALAPPRPEPQIGLDESIKRNQERKQQSSTNRIRRAFTGLGKAFTRLLRGG